MDWRTDIADLTVAQATKKCVNSFDINEESRTEKKEMIWSFLDQIEHATRGDNFFADAG